jgi:putative peptidoglycan lipid II flippase
MASKLESGSIACLNYANVISMIIYNVIGYVISTYAYPVLSKIQNDKEQVKKVFKEYFFILLNLVTPIAVLTMFFSGYVCKLLYGRGNMLENSVMIISKILIMYLPGSIAYCLKNLYSKLFYIKQDTKIVLVLDVIGCLVNISLNLILIRVMGVYGLALATSISYSITVVLQLIIGNVKKYTEFSVWDFKETGIALLVLLILGRFANGILTKYISNSIVQFIYVACVYIVMCAMFSFKDIKKLVWKE